jgi:hypothetical protein
MISRCLMCAGMSTVEQPIKMPFIVVGSPKSCLHLKGCVCMFSCTCVAGIKYSTDVGIL